MDGGEVNSPKYCYTDRLKIELESLFSRAKAIDLWIITHFDNDHISGLYNFINDAEFFDLRQRSHHRMTVQLPVRIADILEEEFFN